MKRNKHIALCNHCPLFKVCVLHICCIFFILTFVRSQEYRLEWILTVFSIATCKGKTYDMAFFDIWESYVPELRDSYSNHTVMENLVNHMSNANEWLLPNKWLLPWHTQNVLVAHPVLQIRVCFAFFMFVISLSNFCVISYQILFLPCCKLSSLTLSI